MKIEITRLTSWKDVLNAARFTQRKEPLDKEPSEDFKRKMIKAEHSPLRCLMFNIDFYDIPYFVSVHLCRHVHCQPFVSSLRPDINKENPQRSEQKKTDPVNMRILLNAQEIINISKVRLCTRAERETRLAWLKAINELHKVEPLLSAACVPSCLYKSFCPEMVSCGFSNTEIFKQSIKDYHKKLNE